MHRVFRLMRGTAGSLLMTVAGTGLFYISQLAILRTLSREDYSLFTLILSSVVLLSLFADLGLAPLLTRMFAEAEVKRRTDDGQEMKSLLWTAVLLKSGIALTAMVVMALVLTLGKFSSNIQLMSLGFAAAFLFSSRILVVRVVGDSLLKALGRYSVVVFANLLDALTLAIAFLFVGNYEFSAVTSALIYGLANLPGYIFMLMVIRRWYNRDLSNAKGRFDRTILRRIGSGGLPLTLATVFMLLHNEGDKILIGALSTIDEVARYRASFAILGALNFLPIVFSSIYNPPAVIALQQGDPLRAKNGVRMGFRLLLMMTGAAVVALAAAPTEIATFLLGGKYGDVGPLVLIIAFEGLFIATAAYLLDLSVMMRNKWAFTKYMGAVMGVATVSDFLLIPSLGAEGAMLAKGIGVLAGCAVLWYEVHGSDIFHLINMAEVAKLALAVVAGAVAGNVLSLSLPFSRPVVGLVVYFLVAGLSRSHPWREIRIQFQLGGQR